MTKQDTWRREQVMKEVHEAWWSMSDKFIEGKTNGWDKYTFMKTIEWDSAKSLEVEFVEQNKGYDHYIYRTLYPEIIKRMIKETIKNVLGVNKPERSRLGNDMTENEAWWNT